jgi:hypothetical protein
MNDAAQIRRCSGALCAVQPLLPAADPQISNREALRLETEVTQTKQTTRPRSNREKEALFLTAGGTEKRAGLKARPYKGNGEQNPNRESRPSNREKSHASQITINPPTSTTRNRGQLHSQIPNVEPSKKAKSTKNDPQSLFRLERTSTVYFQQLTRNLNEPMFRLEMKNDAKKNKRNYSATPPGRLKGNTTEPGITSLVRKKGVEPLRPFGHKILSLARLPVPPLPH